MFLVILLFLVLLFYSYNENFVDETSIDSLHKDFSKVFELSEKSIRYYNDNYMLLYNNLNK